MGAFASTSTRESATLLEGPLGGGARGDDRGSRLDAGPAAQVGRVIPLGGEPGTSLRVLLLEDSAPDRELVELLLELHLPEGRVTSCELLADAVQQMAAGFDVVLADLSLPDAHGLQVVHALHAADGDAAVVVLTGSDDGETALAALGAGAQEYLVKGKDDGARLATAIRHAVQRSRAERLARRYERLSRSLLDALEASTCAVDRQSRIVAVNAAWRAVSPGGEPDARPSYLAVCDAVPAGSDDAPTARQVATGLREVLSGRQRRFSAEYPCRIGDETRWYSVRIAVADVEGGRGALVTHVDVSDLQRTQEALTHQALHDPLTGLPNRALLADRLAQALADSTRRGTSTAVALLDLDHFKRVNDSLGHSSGDALLRQVAERLSGQLRSGDTLARFSGDEFVVVWRDLHHESEVAALSGRLTEALAAPFDVGGSSVTISASTGVALGRSPQTADELLLAADAAMYDAKGHARGRVRLFDNELRRGAGERMATEVGLRGALERDELVLHFQPVVRASTGVPVGVEALVRWQHPERGLLGPDSFIPVAEASGLIVALGKWVLESACRQAASWTGAAAGLDVAVNLSVRKLPQPDVVRHVRNALRSSGLPPERLMLEVTESAVMEDADAAGVALDSLARLGVRIAVDDFGTGYSSLLYLRRYPISAIKVDRAFVNGIVDVADDAAIVSSVVGLAHAVGATSIAEGVETVEQYAALLAFGCQQAQGFLWSRPVPAQDLPAALEGCRAVPVPAPAPHRHPPTEAVDARTDARIWELHRDGASLHTIAAALNRDGARNPSGARWHAHAVARHLAAPDRQPAAQISG
ncbi:hypothetical protein BH24ACT10_BH24ACT10_05840 [soil metagenome]